MKRLKLNNDQINFIGSWKLENDEISKNIINFFEKNIDLQKDGSTGDGKNLNIKKTTDINIHPKNLNDEKLKTITAETRETIIELYTGCENTFIEGLKIYEAIIKNQEFDRGLHKVHFYTNEYKIGSGEFLIK